MSFRMHLNHFKHLLDRVRLKLIRDVSMASLQNGVVEPEVRVADVLRMLAGASYMDLILL